MIQIDGEVDSPHAFSFDDLAALDGQVADVATLVPGRAGGAVRLASLLARVGVRDGARWALLESRDSFSIAVPLEPLAGALVAYRLGDGALPDDKGGPARVYLPGAEKCGVPGLDACAQVKGLARVRLAIERPADTHHH